VAKELCPKNYKTLLQEIKEEKLIEKKSLVYEIVKLNDIRYQYHPNCLIYRFNTILIKIPLILFCKNRKNLKFIISKNFKEWKLWKRTKLEVSHFLISVN